MLFNGYFLYLYTPVEIIETLHVNGPIIFVAEFISKFNTVSTKLSCAAICWLIKVLQLYTRLNGDKEICDGWGLKCVLFKGKLFWCFNFNRNALRKPLIKNNQGNSMMKHVVKWVNLDCIDYQWFLNMDGG